MPNNFPLKILMNFIAIIFIGLVFSPLFLFIEIFSPEPSLKEFLSVMCVLALFFWLVEFFFILPCDRKHFESDGLTPYPDGYPKWKKIVHYSTVGKYYKTYE